MKKRKITYSMTAQQKKRMKRGEEMQKEVTSEATPEGETAVKKNQKKAILICTFAAVLAVVMIFLAIYLPIKLSSETIAKETFTNWKYYNAKDPENPYTSDNPNPNPPANPTATITLTGDDKAAFNAIFGSNEVSLSYEIFMDDAPYAGVNFMYLAESGFYDGTIISDVHRGFAMMSGYTNTNNSANRAFDNVFLRNLKGFVEHTINNSGTKNFKLGYRITAETKRSVLNTNRDCFGYLLMMAGSSSYYSTSTTFMMTVREDPQFNFANDNTSINSYISWLGRIQDDSGYEEVLRKLAQVTTTESGNMHYPVTTIKIKSVKTNLSSAKKKYLLNNFEEIIEDGLAVSTWRTNAYHADYYKFKE